MTTLLMILEAIKDIASIFKMALQGVDEIRDSAIDGHYRERVEKRAEVVAELKKATKEGADNETIKALHERLNNIKR